MIESLPLKTPVANSGVHILESTHCGVARRGAATDTLTPEQRSERMSRIRSRDTKIEIQLRKALFKLGYRFRVNYPRLPGKPDIAFPGRRKVIFINGCLWHAHDCGRYKAPKSNTSFWEAKIGANVDRDQRNLRELKSLGWEVITVWECEMRDLDAVVTRVVSFLEKP
jgi:DNA mismatch endonuclease (patch repair protein)